jgi:hypothetical protein
VSGAQGRGEVGDHVEVLTEVGGEGRRPDFGEERPAAAAHRRLLRSSRVELLWCVSYDEDGRRIYRSSSRGCRCGRLAPVVSIAVNQEVVDGLLALATRPCLRALATHRPSSPTPHLTPSLRARQEHFGCGGGGGCVRPRHGRAVAGLGWARWLAEAGRGCLDRARGRGLGPKVKKRFIISEIIFSEKTNPDKY